jgi:hypothetical protein
VLVDGWWVQDLYNSCWHCKYPKHPFSHSTLQCYWYTYMSSDISCSYNKMYLPNIKWNKNKNFRTSFDLSVCQAKRWFHSH